MLFKILKRRKAWKETDDVIPKGHSVGVKAIPVSICATFNVMKHIGKVDDDVSVCGEFVVQIIWTFFVNNLVELEYAFAHSAIRKTFPS